MPGPRKAEKQSEGRSRATVERGDRVRFSDSTGISWAVRQSTRREAVLSIESRSAAAVMVPILRFDSASSARALSDFPSDWAKLTESELEALCKRARPIPLR